MQREWMTIVAHQSIANQTYLLELQGSLPQFVETPGQFVHIQVSDDFFLRRPVSIADVDSDKGSVTLLYKVMGKGTDALTKKQIGDKLDVLGPSGTGFPIDELMTNKALLIGGGIGVPPLYCLAKNLKARGIEVMSILGFRSREDVFFTEKFQSLGDVHVATNDGSMGTRGFVTDVIPQVDGYDTYFSCGPTVMLKGVKEQLKGVPGYISIEERMGCGVGACFACVVECADEEDTKGYRKICSDGPVFRPEEVIL
ncbi:dihydroorotate dehydrogenase electron transfer subunit [Halobacillus amylolyticus]|uniref:Dihydroorotate dehydrogenase B (NAD(+)), electron transfer subunit n=1 Tax=Halobacillus amylolyticus TaxID=2932259 RepID=A0ABY4HDC4_9BACI|nr:dihydroorotate dehydrogenase electron transfer subunit [Halobacillus amylolyticus]UOR12895.1 dihydroorotate dehydrogenase electron transfer subunit [Halobacillus amylolyticus]